MHDDELESAMLTLMQSLESGDNQVIGTLYSYLADAHMGLAGLDDATNPGGLRQRASRVSRAEMYIDRARECRFISSLVWQIC